jgi:3-hydroxyisobutyrate dehydrogenase-like beta-hydroxyacid dehydrogenase
MKTIGVIGVGNMGLPMVKALRRAGFDVVARDLRRKRRRGRPARGWPPAPANWRRSAG